MANMSVQTFKKTAPKLPARTSIMLRGDHGIGKSQLARRIAKLVAENENILKYELIDRRLSQQSEGDVIGLPSTDGHVTRFNPPDWFRRACDNPCFLFLDELNRATPEVMQAAFQIVLDHELNGWKLHAQTRVMTAINSGASYTINEVDPALLDRFFVVDLTPTVEDFLIWGREENPEKSCGYNLAQVVVDFIFQNPNWLDPPKQSEPGKVQVSRRSWEFVSDALCHAGVIDTPIDETFYNICQGFIGPEAAIAFTDFAKTVDNRFTGEEILNEYKRVRNKIVSKTKAQDILNSAIEKLAEVVVKLDTLTDAQGKNVHDFMEDLPGELRVNLWTKLTAPGIEKFELAKAVHKHTVKLILDVFGVPMGEQGIGVMPNIPGIFKNNAGDNKSASSATPEKK